MKLLEKIFGSYSGREIKKIEPAMTPRMINPNIK